MAKSKSFKCPKCSRTFGMAAHLGRHLSTMHGAASKAGRRKKSAGKGIRRRRGRVGRPRKVGGRVGRPRKARSRIGLSNMTLEQLQDVIEDARHEARRRLAALSAAFG